MHRSIDRRADRAYWCERIEAAETLLGQLESQPQADLLPRMQAELELGLMLAYSNAGDRGRRDPHLYMALDCACTLALGRVCARRGSSFVVELRRGKQRWRLPARPTEFGWPHWLTGFSLALLGACDDRLAILATPDCVDACALPKDQVDPFWPLFCGGMAAMYKRDGLAVDLFDDALQWLLQGDVIDHELLERVYRPTIRAAQALAGGDPGLTTGLLGSALQGRQVYYQNNAESSADPLTLFDIVLSGLHAEAQRRGIGRLPESDCLLPSWACLGDSEIVCVYPRLSIIDASEAEWFLQSEGFLRHDRSIVSQDEKGSLIACYRAYDAPGIPQAEVSLELLDASERAIFDGAHAPPALDVGELLYRAERLASQPQRTADGEPGYDLAQAIQALDLALQYLSAMPGGFRPETLHSTVGQQMYTDEPGRFRSERVSVYRSALARQAGMPISGQGAGGGVEPRRDVMALIEELKPLVLPILREIVLDRTGEAVRRLAPEELDYERAFVGEAIDAAREFYGDRWRAHADDMTIDAGDVVDVYLAPAGMLATDNELSYQFPRGFRQIAPWLDPHRVWVSWRYRQPGGTSGTTMNGLVWLDDHWAWFPKPYRIAGRIRRH